MIGRTGECSHEVLTPAKTDDFSRPSSIRLPKQGLRSPVTSYKQLSTRINEDPLSSPLTKRPKSRSRSPISHPSQVPESVRISEKTGGMYLTPPHRSLEKDMPGAPRKRRESVLADEGTELFMPSRSLDFGFESVSHENDTSLHDVIDWDPVTLKSHEDSVDAKILRRAMSAIALSGLDTRDNFSLVELKKALKSHLTDVENQRCISLLKQFDDCIYFEDQGNQVRFPLSFSPAEVVRRCSGTK